MAHETIRSGMDTERKEGKPEEQYFLSWEEAFDSAVTEAGGKGKNLARLQRYGFPVPAGGILTSRAYRDFLQHNDLVGSIRTLDSIKADDVLANEGILAEIREKIIKGHLPGTIKNELAERLAGMELLDRAVAVRSSAAAEDSASASFAGVHGSFLNITGLEQIVRAVKDCYASLWTARAVSYRRRPGMIEDDVAVAVVIMELVPAVAAGVAFSCDPRTGRQDRLMVSSNFGLGESVVSGAVEPDEYVLDTGMVLPQIIEKKIGSKRKYTKLKHGGGTELVDTDAGERQVLDENRIIEVGMLTLRVYEALGSGAVHQDVEWAFDGSKFFVLQARPVTGVPVPTFPEVASQPVIWSNANIKDAVPLVLTTLSWSCCRGILNIMLGSNLLASGYRVPEEIYWVRLYQGRGYFNLSAVQWAYYDAFGYLPAEINTSVGGHQPEIKVPPGNPLGGLTGIKRIWRRMRFMSNILRMQHSADRKFEDMWNTVGVWNQRNLHIMNNDELIAHISGVIRKVFEYAFTFVILSFSSSFYFGLLSKALDNAFPGRGISMANSLMAGASEITSAEHGYRLMELAKTAKKDEAARSYFTAELFSRTAWQDEIPVSSQFRKEFELFLKEFGHRGVYEVEVQNPRWREDPGYLLDIIRTEVLSPGTNDYRAVQTARREAAEKEIADKFKWRRAKINMLKKQAAKGAGMREMAKSVMVKPLETTRLFYQEVGSRLEERGILDEKADIYHCAWHELAAILAGYWDGTGLKILVRERKQKRKELSDLDPPDVIINEVPQPGAQPFDTRGSVLAGMGVAAGKASGPARLIRHPEENSRLRSGDVLVAPSTDPGWTPLFLRAKAVVMEVGGYLSHGAIVAREYGIPAVVNVPGVMKIVRDGDLLTVDGDEGKVYRNS